MINKINSLDAYNRITFTRKVPTQKTAQHVSVTTKGHAMQQVNSIKSVCKEILLRVANDKSLIAKTAAVLGAVKLTETAITFFANDDRAIRLSMPRGPQGELFKMQLMKDNKPEESVILDTYGKVVESYGREIIQYMPDKKVDLDKTAAIITGIYGAVDDSLFNVRMFMRNNANSTHIVANKLDNIVMPDIQTILQKQKANEAKPTPIKHAMPSAKIIKDLPSAGTKHNYSFREVIKQNEEKTKKIIQNSAIKSKKSSIKPSIETAEKVKRVKTIKVEKAKKPAGVVPSEIQAKVIKSIDLFETVKAELQKVSPMTALLARKNYNVQIGNVHHFIFEDIDVVVKAGKNYDNQKVLSIKDNLTEDSIKILDSGKVLENSKDI